MQIEAIAVRAASATPDLAKIQAHAGVASDHIDKAYTLGASEFEVILEVIWRQVLPRVLENLRLQIGLAGTIVQ